MGIRGVVGFFGAVLLLGACALDTDDPLDLVDGTHEEEEESEPFGQTSDALVNEAYQWPLKPFHQQHPIRGFLNDPRQGGPVSCMVKGEACDSETFHFGIDVAGEDGTEVFAIEAGTVTVKGPATISIVSDGGRRSFAYYHMVHDGLKNGQHVVKEQPLGRIQKTWGHVHISESQAGRYVNPLRRGGIAPFGDFGPPKIAASNVTDKTLHGKVNLVVEAADVTPVPVPDPRWTGFGVGVGMLRWRITRKNGAEVTEWKTGVDLRETMLPKDQYHAVFAPGTMQNHPKDEGLYRYFVAHGWDTTTVANGAYALEIEASDVRDNESKRSFPFTVQN